MLIGKKHINKPHTLALMLLYITPIEFLVQYAKKINGFMQAVTGSPELVQTLTKRNQEIPQ